MSDYLDKYITELLHVEDVTKNKLVSLTAGDLTKTIYLKNDEYESLSQYVLRIINERIGKVGTTVLNNSVLGEQKIGHDLNFFDWSCADNTHDAKRLNDFIASAYKDITFRGNNPLFLSIGTLNWCVYANEQEIKLQTPLLIFPIRLVRNGITSPISIEFIADDININPCLIEKLKTSISPAIIKDFPHPNGAGIGLDEPIDLERLSTGTAYFKDLSQYLDSCVDKKNQENVLFALQKDVIAISSYNHDEVCMYYDIMRNIDKISSHPLVERVFTPNSSVLVSESEKATPVFIENHDIYQEEMVASAVAGQSMIIKGPPGTGKTLTIANIIASLLNQGKRVLFSSKKISALSEVKAKLPQNLRDFTLLLDFETEAETAKVNPTEIKQELRDLVLRKRHYKFNDNQFHDFEQIKNRMNESSKTVVDYYKIMFDEKRIYGDTLYNALDIYFKYDKMPIIPIVEKSKALLIDRKLYNLVKELFINLESEYLVLTHDDTIPLLHNPWFGYSEKENTYEAYCLIANKIEELYDYLNQNFSKFSCLSLLTIDNLSKCEFDEDAIVKLFKYRNDPVFNEIINNYDCLTSKEKVFVYTGDGADLDAMKTVVDSTKLPRKLPFNELSILNKSLIAINEINGKTLELSQVTQLFDIYNKMAKINQEKEDHLRSASRVFKKGLSNVEIEKIASANKYLEKYKTAATFKVFDFQAKKQYRELVKLSYLDDPSISEVASAVYEYSMFLTCVKASDLLVRSVYQVFGCSLDDNQLQMIQGLYQASEKYAVKFSELIDLIMKDYNKVEPKFNMFENNKDMTLEVLSSNIEYWQKIWKIERLLIPFNEKIGLYENIELVKTSFIARSLVAIAALFNTEQAKYIVISDIIKFINYLKADQKVAQYIAKLTTMLEEFYTYNIANYYTINALRISFDYAYKLSKHISNRADLNAYLNYTRLINSDYPVIDILGFAKKFENGEISKNGISFADYFEHSMYYSAISGLLDSKPNLTTSLWTKLNSSRSQILDCENEIHDINAKFIEKKLMDQIDVTSPIYDFLAHEKESGSLRSLFKNHAQAILSLKKCIIVTPSTASILFRPIDYQDFDVLICDEASQLEPVSLLPVLFRSKQCIIVGDEWQMPPIKHFRTKRETILSFDEFVDPDNSALGLAIKNNAFKTYELVCHYRSETESLIQFSQRRFYRYMRTLPAPSPKTDDLGFTDIFVENATCEQGENLEEAKAVVCEINRLFDKYYQLDHLTQSIGIVGFGLKQVELILSLVAKDKELTKKIETAKENFEDPIKEKLIFFKTIETVQGQEIDHLILSLTYGVTKDGSFTHSFGQLNSSKLGQCIFNVAVTRAKKSVSVIHSIKSEQIKADSTIDYIKEYLEIANKFSLDGKSQFIGEVMNSGFVKNVSDFVKSCGIDEARIVYNYGVTEQSIRIPLAILDKDLNNAVLGIWCEKNEDTAKLYIDNTIHYVDALSYRWKLYPINIFEWYYNGRAAKQQLQDVLEEIS